jgi:hypothetical protein
MKISYVQMTTYIIMVEFDHEAEERYLSTLPSYKAVPPWNLSPQ